jgi:glycosyltransferase involved in cell wall biosynthesis
MHNINPTFSIITVVYNGANFIAETVESVLNQTYNNFEYLIIDGKSKDNTLALIKKYDSDKIKIYSEPDKGLYDAMNKGIKLATGNFLLFLNAGDYLNSNDVLGKINGIIETQNPDVIYGETMLVDIDKTLLGTRSQLTVQKLPKVLEFESMKYGMVICHQSFFIAKKITPLYIYENLTADYDWMLNCINKSKKNINANFIITNFLVGGISKQKHWQSLKDRFYIMKKHYGVFETIFSHIYILIRATLFKFTRKT